MEKKEIFIKAAAGQAAADMFPGTGSFIARVDGNAAQDKQSMMKAVAASFRFPEYFGENWDALADCLRSLPEEMEDYSCFVLEISDYPAFLSKSAADRKDFEEIFMDAAAFVKDAFGKRLAAVLL